MTTNEIKLKSCTTGVIIQGSSNNIRFGNVNIGNSSSLQEDNFDLPKPIKIYTGRETEIKLMETLFFNKNKEKRKNKVVICGIAGIGKSELAVQFADKCQKAGKIKKVYRIIAEHEGEIIKSWQQINNIYKKSKKGKRLFILDNGISINKISTCGFEMPDKFFFIITSQIKDWGDDIVQIELSTLDATAAVEFYKNKLENVYTDKDRNLLEELANLVGCLPLGLQITAAGVREYKKIHGANCVHKYLNELKKSENKVIDETFPSSSDNPYGKSIKKAIEMILEIN